MYIVYFLTLFCPLGSSRVVSKASSSNVSKVTNLEEIPFFVLRSDIPYGYSDRIESPYTLRDIADAVGLDFDTERISISSKININEEIAAACIKKYFKRRNLKIFVDREVPGMSNLSALCASSKQRIDIVAHEDKRFVFAAVVQSSSTMKETEIKATLGAVDLIRLLRLTDDKFDTVEVFALPNETGNSCIVKIKVQ